MGSLYDQMIFITDGRERGGGGGGISRNKRLVSPGNFSHKSGVEGLNITIV